MANEKFIIRKGLSANIPQPLAGQLIFTTDTKKIYLDNGSSVEDRIEICPPNGENIINIEIVGNKLIIYHTNGSYEELILPSNGDGAGTGEVNQTLIENLERECPVVFTGLTESGNSGVSFDNGVTINPSTNTITADLNGVAQKAINDISGNPIASTYISSISLVNNQLVPTYGNGSEVETQEKITIPNNKVAQYSTSTAAEYPITFAYSANPTSGTSGLIRYNNNITINPSTKTITADNFAGNATSATTATTAEKATKDSSGNTITNTYISSLALNTDNNLVTTTGSGVQKTILVPYPTETELKTYIKSITIDSSKNLLTYVNGNGGSTDLILPDGGGTGGVASGEVNQLSASSNSSYPLLLATSGRTSSGSDSTYFNSGVTLNPSTKTITATTFAGNATSATTAATAEKATYDSNGQKIIDTYLTKTDANSYLKINDANSTYLTKDSASNTYLTKTDANSTYLTKYDANDIYLTEDDVSGTYLTKAEASSAYLTKVNANDTYLTKTGASSIYLTKTDANSTYLTNITKDMVTTALGYTPPEKDTNTTYGVFNSSTAGLVPSGSGNDAAKYLNGNGKWTTPTMAIPTATSTSLGGIKVGSGLSINNGVLSVTISGSSDVSYTPILTSGTKVGTLTIDGSGYSLYAPSQLIYTLASFGVSASSTEINYLNGVTSNVQVQLNELSTAIQNSKYELPIAKEDSLGGIKVGAGFRLDNDGTLSISDNNHNHTLSNITDLATITDRIKTLEEKEDKDTIYSVFTLNTNGLVPGPTLGTNDYYLSASGSWESLYSVLGVTTADSSAAGLVSPSDIAKLNSLKNYILPIAGDSLGGIKSGGDITVDSNSGEVTVNDKFPASYIHYGSSTPSGSQGHIWFEPIS